MFLLVWVWQLSSESVSLAFILTFHRQQIRTLDIAPYGGMAAGGKAISHRNSMAASSCAKFVSDIWVPLKIAQVVTIQGVGFATDPDKASQETAHLNGRIALPKMVSMMVSSFNRF